MRYAIHDHLNIINVVYLLMVGLMATVWAWQLGMFQPATDVVVDIPNGSAEALASGQGNEIIPAEFSLREGDRLILNNQDVEGHRVGGLYVDANSSVTANFRDGGTFTYFCSVHPTGQTVFDVAEKPSLLPLAWAMLGAIGAMGLLNGIVLGGVSTPNSAVITLIGIAAMIGGVFQSLSILANPVDDGPIGTNPIPPSANSVSAGSGLYQQFCSTCHGIEGYGDGPLAIGLDPPPSDLFVHIPQHGDNVLYQFVQEGIPGTAMPPFRDGLEGDDTWHLVNYLRTIQ